MLIVIGWVPAMTLVYIAKTPELWSMLTPISRSVEGSTLLVDLKLAMLMLSTVTRFV